MGPGLQLTAHPNLPFNGLHLCNPCNYMDSVIYRPWRDGRLSWPSWLTHSGCLAHKVVTRQPWIRRRSGKVHQLQTDILTTEPRCQTVTVTCVTTFWFNPIYTASFTNSNKNNNKTTIYKVQ